MKGATSVTLQISLAPTDLPHATHTVPHQLRQWAGQVDEVLFVLDMHRSRGKFADGWQARLPGMRALIEEWCSIYPHARSVDVAYTEETRAAVERTFFNGLPIPSKDHRGAPFYAYLYALMSASNDFVFHLDSDMMFGGGSATWIGEALRVLEARPEVLACNPLPGPPTDDGSLRSQTLAPDMSGFPAFRSTGLSARLFLVDRRRLSHLQVERPTPVQAWGARVDGNPPFLPLEDVISHAMRRSGHFRLDFLGREPGMWSLHPPYRSPLFYERLPSLISEIERGDVPEAQRGRHEVEDCTVDWSDVRPTPLRRIDSHSRLLLKRVWRPAQRS